jgi:hypothetical protein
MTSKAHVQAMIAASTPSIAAQLVVSKVAVPPSTTAPPTAAAAVSALSPTVPAVPIAVPAVVAAPRAADEAEEEPAACSNRVLCCMAIYNNKINKT